MEKDCHQEHPDSSTSSDVEPITLSKPPQKKKNYLLQQLLLQTDDLTRNDSTTNDNAIMETIAGPSASVSHVIQTRTGACGVSGTADYLKTSNIQIGQGDTTLNVAVLSSVVSTGNGPYDTTRGKAVPATGRCDPVDIGCDELFLNLPPVFDDTLLTGQFDQGMTSELSLEDLASWLPNEDSQLSSVHILPNNSLASFNNTSHVQKPARRKFSSDYF